MKKIIPDEPNYSIILSDCFWMIKSEIKIIVSCSFLATVLGILFALSKSPVYEANALLQIEKSSGSVGETFSDFDDVFHFTSPTQAEIEILYSNKVLSQVVAKERLDIKVTGVEGGLIDDYILKTSHSPVLELEQMELSQELLNEAFEVRVIASNKVEIHFEGKRMGEAELGVPFEKEIKFLSTIKNHKVKFLFTEKDLSINSSFIVQKVDIYKAVQDLQNSLGILERGKKSGIVALALEYHDPFRASEILNSIIDIYKKQNLALRSEDAKKTIKFLDTQLPLLQAKLESSEDELNKYRNKVSSINLTEETKLTLGKSIDVESKIMTLRQKKAEILRLYKEDNHRIKVLDRQILNLKRNLTKMNRKVQNLPEIQQKIVRLTRAVKVNSELYMSLMNNYQKLQIIQAGEIGNAKIIDYSVPAIRPIRPRKATIVLLFMVLGFLTSIALVLLRKALQGVQSSTEFENILSTPILGEIHIGKKNKKNELSFLQKEEDPIAWDSLRSMALNVQMLAPVSPVIRLFVAPRDGVGKAFVGINYGKILAESGQKVLLIDTDFRKKTWARAFPTLKKAGILEWFDNNLEESLLIQKTNISNLDFISSGTLSQSPPLNFVERLKPLFESICEGYDHVFLNSEPLLAVADTIALSKCATSNILILQSKVHNIEELTSIKDAFSKASVVLDGVVINQVRFKDRKHSFERYLQKYSKMVKV